MISAVEAYALANSHRADMIEKEWKNIEKRIQDAAEKGNFDYCYRGQIMLENIKKLQELGYEIEVENSFREIVVYISWKGKEIDEQ